MISSGNVLPRVRQFFFILVPKTIHYRKQKPVTLHCHWLLPGLPQPNSHMQKALQVLLHEKN